MNTAQRPVAPPRLVKPQIRLKERMKREAKIRERIANMAMRKFWRILEQSLVRLGFCGVVMFLPYLGNAAIAAMVLVLIMFVTQAIRCLHSLYENSK